jgi:tetratricopeptide (TPR) repeat protein
LGARAGYPLILHRALATWPVSATIPGAKGRMAKKNNIIISTPKITIPQYFNYKKHYYCFMKILIAFMLFPLLVSAQDNAQTILGTWIKTKAEMKDGSRIIDRLGTQSGFLVNRFTKNDTAFFWYDPILSQIKNDDNISGSKLPYKINDSLIYIGKIGYQLIKLTNDSLIFMDKAPGLYDDKIRKFYFTKMELHHSDDKPVYDDAIKDSVYNITNFIFPQSLGSIDPLTKQLHEIFANGSLKLRLIIDKDGRMKDLSVLENKNLSKRTEQKVKDALWLGKDLWRPAYVNNKPVNVNLEITLLFISNNMFASLSYITPLAEKKPVYKNVPMDMLDKERDAFNRGVALAKQHEYDKALVQLTRVIEIDDINLDAYYLRATIYFEMGNKKAACDDWGKLAQLGQVLATKYLTKYCNN